jgi:hypothetical protein
VAAVSFLVAPLAFGGGALFPRPLHLVRRVDDPISKTSATIDEYCIGNRVVTVRGAKVTIADYDAQQLTEIDHAAQTWSVTTFADIAQSRAALDARMGIKSAPREARMMVSGTRSPGNVETFVDETPHRRLDIGIDRRVTLSRGAAEVLIGAAYPAKVTDEETEILAVAGSSGSISAMSVRASAAETYGLVTERTLTIDSDGTRLVSRNSIIRIGDEMAAAETTLIDPGAKRIESRLTRLARELRDIDTLPAANALH